MATRHTRDQMIRGAAELLAGHGVQGTSFSDVIAHTGTPRGSIYHHFPGGKDELVAAAARSIGDAVTGLLDSLVAETPADVIDAFIGGWRTVLVSGGYERGCAVAATCLGSSAESELRTVAASIFDAWRVALTRALVRSGSAEDDAEDLAVVCLAAVEGALVLARAAHDDAVFDALQRQLRRLVPR